jgi:hypothetical protein
VAASKEPTGSLADLRQRPGEKLATAAIKPAIRIELPGPAEPAGKPSVELRTAPVVSPSQALASAKTTSGGDRRISEQPPAAAASSQRLQMPVVMRPAGANPREQPPRVLAGAVVQPIQAPPLLTVPHLLPSGPAPVISPSPAMQALREQERSAVLPENKPLVNPYLKPRPADTAVRQATPEASGTEMDAMEQNVAPALFAAGSTVAEMNGVVMSEFAEALKPAAQEPVAGPTAGNPLFAPRDQLPGPMDQIPPEARFLQMPTSHLHPNAQPTWSAQNRPVAGTAQQPTMKSAHYFDWTGKTNP